MADLTQVISLLSPASLELLHQVEPGIQAFVIETITCCVNAWEDRKVVLDPITREAVLDSLVAIHIASAQGFTQLLINAHEAHNAACDR